MKTNQIIDFGDWIVMILDNGTSTRHVPCMMSERGYSHVLLEDKHCGFCGAELPIDVHIGICLVNDGINLNDRWRKSNA